MNGLGSRGDSSICECYYITNRRAFWNQRSCNSSQQWICQFAPKTRSTKMQHASFIGLQNITRFGMIGTTCCEKLKIYQQTLLI
uniref:C-type lectin domain-containing protein n=1 Tax=Elaeophora elaphi TaxID=1147741 RepID=A0A0R3RJM3_9BILA